MPSSTKAGRLSRVTMAPPGGHRAKRIAAIGAHAGGHTVGTGPVPLASPSTVESPGIAVREEPEAVLPVKQRAGSPV